MSMARFASQLELEAFLQKLDPDYAKYTSPLWQIQVRTAHQLANASKPLLLSCGLVELHVDDIRARANGTDHQRLAGALSSSDRIRPDGKIAVLKRGDLETGDKRLLSLYKRGDDALNLQKDGKPVGQLLLINIKEMVPTESATVEVLGPNGETVESFLPEDDSNGLSQELLVYDSVIRVLPFRDPRLRQAWAVIVAHAAGFLTLLVTIVTLILHDKSHKT
ncbi:TPA: hypothetical protein ACH3X2_009722 [Trebouxia sp. C0005]